jgi:HSP20 family protein
MRIIQYTYPNRLAPSVPSFALSARSPWSGLESELDRLFGSALSAFAGMPSDGQFPVDLYEDKENVYVRAELPGVKREDINLETADGSLTIQGTRRSVAADGKVEESVSFSRSVGIPAEVQADKAGAVCENGVLTVTLPKREEAKPKKIAIAVK